MKKHRTMLNKKAQENIFTDVIVTLVIVVIISASFFTANIMFKDRAQKDIKAKMLDIQSKRMLLTMLKTPISGTDTFGDFIIKHYYDDKKGLELSNTPEKAVQQLTESSCIIMKEFLGEFGKEYVVQTPLVSITCYNVGARSASKDLFLYKACDYTKTEQTAHIPLENSYIEVYIQLCSCIRSVHKSYSAPEIYCDDQLVQFANAQN